MSGLTFKSNTRVLKDYIRRMPEKIEGALYAEANIEMTEMKRRTPVDTGALRASGTVHPPVREGRKVSVEMSFGGAAEAYAIPVHEDLEAFHKEGQAKYAESVLQESQPHMADRLKNRLDLNKV